MTAQTEWLQSSVDQHVSYPAAPWHMVGSSWLSLFRLAERVDEVRPAGLYGATFVSYEEGSSLTYHELLVARPIATEEHGRRLSITDIWVDSPESAAGGRELWAIPKGLCDFSLDTSHAGPLTATEWTATVGRTPIATARFKDVSRAAPRLPFRSGTWQPGIDDTAGQERAANLQGSAKALPARAHWDINPDGPLGWLAGARRLASFRQSCFSISFG